MLGRTDSRRRLLFLLVTFVVIAASLLTRLAYWQVVAARPARPGGIRPDDDAPGVAEPARRHLRPERGRRPGHDRRPGASCRDSVRVELRPSPRGGCRADQPARPRGRRREGAEGPDVNRQEVRRPRSRSRQDDGRPDPCGRGIEEGRGRTARSRSPIRVYPHEGGGPDSTLAAHLLGFVNRDGIGQYGVEQYYQDLLGGRPRIVHAQRDVAARAIPDTIVVEDPGTPWGGPPADDRRRACSWRSSRSSSTPGRRTRRRTSRPSSWTRTAGRSSPRRVIPRTTATSTRRSRRRTRHASSTRSSARCTSRAPSSRC